MSALPTTTPWVARLAPSQAGTLDVARLVPGLTGLEAGPWLWVAGPAPSPAHAVHLAAVPWERRFFTDGEWLFEPGKSLPWGRLPEGRWQPLASLLVPRLPAAALPGQLRNRALLELRQAGPDRPATLVRLSVRHWFEYAQTAPAVRLASLSYVMREQVGLALVRGSPLPPVSGDRYYIWGPLAIPLGWEITPPLPVAVLTSWLGLSKDDMALFDTEGTFTRIPGAHWRPADRASIRANCAPSSR